MIFKIKIFENTSKSKRILENLGELIKFLENKHNMASELSKDNGMYIRLYNQV